MIAPFVTLQKELRALCRQLLQFPDRFSMRAVAWLSACGRTCGRGRGPTGFPSTTRVLLNQPVRAVYVGRHALFQRNAIGATPVSCAMRRSRGCACPAGRCRARGVGNILIDWRIRPRSVSPRRTGNAPIRRRTSPSGLNSSAFARNHNRPWQAAASASRSARARGSRTPRARPPSGCSPRRIREANAEASARDGSRSREPRAPPLRSPSASRTILSATSLSVISEQSSSTASSARRSGEAALRVRLVAPPQFLEHLLIRLIHALSSNSGAACSAHLHRRGQNTFSRVRVRRLPMSRRP